MRSTVGPKRHSAVLEVVDKFEHPRHYADWYPRKMYLVDSDILHHAVFKLPSDGVTWVILSVLMTCVCENGANGFLFQVGLSHR